MGGLASGARAEPEPDGGHWETAPCFLGLQGKEERTVRLAGSFHRKTPHVLRRNQPQGLGLPFEWVKVAGDGPGAS